MPDTRIKYPQGALLIVPAKNGTGFYWEAKYRVGGRQRKVRLGRAHVKPRAKPLEPSADDRRASWELRYSKLGGKPSGALTHADAVVALAARIKSDVEEAGKSQTEAVAPVTISEAADAWIVHRQRKRGLRPSTLAEYRATLRAYILSSPHLAGPIEDIDIGNVTAWRNELHGRTGDRALSPRTVNKARTILHGIFASAMRPVALDGYGLETNPVQWVEPIAEEEAEPREPLTPSEVVAVARALGAGLHRTPRQRPVGPRQKGRKLVAHTPTAEEAAAMREQDQQDAAAVLVLAFGGLRAGELAALRWHHIDFAGGRIRVERSYSAFGQIETGTKGRERRWTLLPDQVAEPLARLGQRERFTADDDLVFSMDGKSYMDMSAFRRRFKRAVAAAGIKRHVRVHDLRHGATTDLRSVFSADHVQRMVGHRDARTAQRYAHARDQQDAATRWSDYLAAQIATEVEA